MSNAAYTGPNPPAPGTQGTGALGDVSTQLQGIVRNLSNNYMALTSLIAALQAINFPQTVQGFIFANLPAAPAIGTMAYVTDSNTNTWGANIAGSGADTVLAWWNGTHWTVVGK